MEPSELTEMGSLRAVGPLFRLTVEDLDGRVVFDRVIPPTGLHIGRQTPCEVLLKGTAVSRKHARVAVDEEGPFISDLGSANGTLVDGIRIGADTGLDDRSLIEIGEYRLRVMEIREIRESGSFTIFVPPPDPAPTLALEYGLNDSDEAVDTILTTPNQRSYRPSGSYRTGLIGYLLVTDRPGADEVITLDRDELTLGRDAANDLILDRVGITRFHARFSRQDMRWSVSDTGIPGSVLVDGVAVRTHVLRDGETIVLGNTPLIYTTSDKPGVRAELLQRSADGGNEAELRRRERKGLIVMLLVLAALGLTATASITLFRMDDPGSSTAAELRTARDKVRDISARFDARPAARARALASSGDWSGSLAAYDEAVRRAPGDAALAAERSLIRSRAAAEQAVAACNTIFTNGVERYTSTRNHAGALAEMSRAEECLHATAKESATRAKSETLLHGSVYPSLLGIRLALGDAAATAGDCAGASEHYHQARTISQTIAKATSFQPSTAADRPLAEQAALCGDQAYEGQRWNEAVLYYLTAGEVGPLTTSRSLRLSTARQAAGAAQP